MDDLISRQAAIDAVLDRMNVEKHGRDAKPEEIQWALEKLPSAQPEHLHTVMEKIGKRYAKAMNTPRIKNPMAWALYETWKEYDR